MSSTPKRPKIIVRYWRGTMRHTGKATTYRGALRIASRNRNAWPARFYDEDGNELHDDGNGLATEKDIENNRYSF